uniref:Uncharacterized protein n=1 Tax=Leersia perrieri TaxID=77586 RepID=A0A0D9WPV8_9ORYZ
MAVFVLAFMVVVPVFCADSDGRVQVQSMEGAASSGGSRNGTYNSTSVAGRKDGGGGGGKEDGGSSGVRTERDRDGGGSEAGRHRRPSYSPRLYRVGEYARCTEATGRCRGALLVCPMQCEGPCFYDCGANCKAHCRF